MHPVDLIAHQSFSCLNYAGLGPFFDSQHPRSDTTSRGFGHHAITAQECPLIYCYIQPELQNVNFIAFKKTKRTFTVKTIPNICRIARTVV